MVPIKLELALVPAALDPIDNRFAVIAAGNDIARGDPTAQSGTLQRMDNCVRLLLILRGVADEDVELLRWAG